MNRMKYLVICHNLSWFLCISVVTRSVKALYINSTESSLDKDPLIEDKTVLSIVRDSLEANNTAITTDIHGDEDNNGKGDDDWLYQENIRGYKIYSDGIKFKTKILKSGKVVHIRVETGSARTVEKIMYRRNVELKIGTWNKVFRVRVKVPFGFMPQELRILEKPRYIDIYAPFDFIEFAHS